MDLTVQLNQLGFSKNEIAVYLALLTNGSSMAGNVAKSTRLERTSTYSALNRLEQQGLVSVTYQTKRKIFSAASPKRLADFFREKEQQAQLLAPELEKLASLSPKEDIQKFTGIQGVKNSLMDILASSKNNDEYLAIGLAGNLSKELPTFAKIFVSRRNEKKLKARVIVRPSQGQFVTSKLTKMRKLDIANDESFSTLNVNVYADKVSLIIWSKTPQAIIIQNPSVHYAFRAYFEVLWKQAKK